MRNIIKNAFSQEVELSKRLLAHLSLLLANILYGINYVIAKGIMPDYLSPRAIIFIRVVGALIVFHIIHAFFVKEKVAKKDLLKIGFCAIFGVAINQIMFFEGLNKTTEINSSIIMTINPIMVLIFSYFLLKDKPTFLKISGITLGLAGTLYLILSKGEISFSSDTFLGNLLIVINASSFAFYLVIIKPILKKYKPITVVKWLFTFGFLWILPFSYNEIIEADLSAIPANIWGSIIYIVIATTIVGYLLYVFALQHISPTVTSFYMYLQPLLASLTVIILGMDTLSYVEVISAILIFIGVYMVSYKKSN